MEFVKIIHPDLGPDHIAEVPESALPHHYRSGWRRLAEDEFPPLEPETEPPPMTRAEAAKATRKATMQGKE